MLIASSSRLTVTVFRFTIRTIILREGNIFVIVSLSRDFPAMLTHYITYNQFLVISAFYVKILSARDPNLLPYTSEARGRSFRGSPKFIEQKYKRKQL